MSDSRDIIWWRQLVTQRGRGQHVYIELYHHHYVMLRTLISLTLSHHLSLLSIASSRSSELHPVSVQSCYRYVPASGPTFLCLYEGVHRRMTLMSLSLLFQQCPTCLACLIWTIFEMWGRWPYSCCHFL